MTFYACVKEDESVFLTFPSTDKQQIEEKMEDLSYEVDCNLKIVQFNINDTINSKTDIAKTPLVLLDFKIKISNKNLLSLKYSDCLEVIECNFSQEKKDLEVNVQINDNDSIEIEFTNFNSIFYENYVEFLKNFSFEELKQYVTQDEFKEDLKAYIIKADTSKLIALKHEFKESDLTNFETAIELEQEHHIITEGLLSKFLVTEVNDKQELLELTSKEYKYIINVDECRVDVETNQSNIDKDRFLFSINDVLYEKNQSRKDLLLREIESIFSKKDIYNKLLELTNNIFSTNCLDINSYIENIIEEDTIRNNLNYEVLKVNENGEIEKLGSVCLKSGTWVDFGSYNALYDKKEIYYLIQETSVEETIVIIEETVVPWFKKAKELNIKINLSFKCIKDYYLTYVVRNLYFAYDQYEGEEYLSNEDGYLIRNTESIYRIETKTSFDNTNVYQIYWAESKEGVFEEQDKKYIITNDTNYLDIYKDYYDFEFVVANKFLSELDAIHSNLNATINLENNDFFYYGLRFNSKEGIFLIKESLEEEQKITLDITKMSEEEQELIIHFKEKQSLLEVDYDLSQILYTFRHLFISKKTKNKYRTLLNIDELLNNEWLNTEIIDPENIDETIFEDENFLFAFHMEDNGKIKAFKFLNKELSFIFDNLLKDKTYNSILLEKDEDPNSFPDIFVTYSNNCNNKFISEKYDIVDFSKIGEKYRTKFLKFYIDRRNNKKTTVEEMFDFYSLIM